MKGGAYCERRSRSK